VSDTAVITLMLGLLIGAGFTAIVNAALSRARACTTEAARTGLAADREAAIKDATRLRSERDELVQRTSEVAAQLAGAQAQMAAERRAAADRFEFQRSEQERLLEQFRALSADALRHNNEAFLTLADERFKASQQVHVGELEQRKQAVESLVAPLKETLGRVEGQLRELETARVTAYTALTEQVGFVRTSSDQLRRETSALVQALRAPQTRGRWGEMQLRRVVELAGMVNHVDFDEQATVATDDGPMRPDMVVRLAGGKNIVVDSKVTLAAYLEAADSTDEAVRTDRMAAHARHLRKHVDDLSAKVYWAQFAPAPEFVVLFVPGEAFLAPALELEPTLLEYAMAKRVIVATPTTLMSLLRTVGYAWQQAALTDNARAVFDLGRELYDRLGRLGEHVDKLGRSIGRVVTDYNSAIGSLETRVLVTARRLADLNVVEGELISPSPVEDDPKSLSAAPLIESAVLARTVRTLPVELLDDVELDDRYGVSDPAVPARQHGEGA
jgi:DNA recombination protein RmuC